MKHGHATGGTVTAEYRAWAHMIERCTNPNSRCWHHYGGRGIRVCKRWLSFGGFLADMGYRPGPGYSLDRIDNDSDYRPSNCRWATQRQQLRNTRRTRLLTHHGETLCLKDWATKLSINYRTLRTRIRLGHSVDRVLAVGRAR